jgi:cation diffusion facilitator CzcD-associated flavoprotein CzcO
MTEYVDFPFPEEYPDYPHQRQVWEYLRSYARYFGLYESIEFGRSVECVERAGDDWEVTLDGGETRLYGGVVIANGHLWDPKYPDFPGHFDGETIHSTDYKTSDILRNRRVLVVGAGNSGCDIAVEAAQNAKRTFHSMRRGYHYMPKYFMGMPADVMAETMLRWRMPLALRRMTASLLAKMVLGWPQDFGLPKPDHRLLESHPIINSQMLYYVGHGDITVKPNVEQLCGDRVRFTDGSEEEIDLIVYATGFNIRFPFIDEAHLNWKDGRPNFYLFAFHPAYDNLFIAGLLQPDSGLFGLVDWQARLIARFVKAQTDDGPRAEKFRKMKAKVDPHGFRRLHYINSTRHLVEVEHFPYRNALERACRMFA